MDNLIKYKIKISKMDITNNQLIIESDDGKQFVSEIKKGSVNFKIFNETEQEVNLGNLEENKLVTIFGSLNIINENKLMEKNKDKKNIIIINKIRVKNNYIFDSESSDDITEFE